MIKKNAYFAIKRAFDFTVALIGLIIFSPLFVITCILIKIDDPEGGSFFVQERYGKDRKLFRMYKFRTMHVNAEDMIDNLLDMNEEDGPAFKIKDDPRITRIGGFLRKTHIDELPQLFNVLKGEMSLVGPRPPLPREVKRYNEWHYHKLDAKQGMTCYWQVADKRNEIPFDEWIALDLKYIKEQSILTDIKILLKTIGVVLKMNGM